eukprot:7380638-Prymnesium_polylepis.1
MRQLEHSNISPIGWSSSVSSWLTPVCLPGAAARVGIETEFWLWARLREGRGGGQRGNDDEDGVESLCEAGEGRSRQVQNGG